MNSFFLTSSTGRVALLIFGLNILLPYLLRNTWLSRALGLAPVRSTTYLRCMWPHYWCGYVLPALCIAHTWISMTSASIARLNMAGLWLATLGLLLLLLQAAIGLSLRQPHLPTRKSTRSWHYWITVAVAFLVAAHVWLNG